MGSGVKADTDNARINYSFKNKTTNKIGRNIISGVRRKSFYTILAHMKAIDLYFSLPNISWCGVSF